MNELTLNDKLFSNRSLFKLIWPLLVEQILGVTLGIADVMMVATLGQAAVSGVSLVDSINILLFGLFSALGTGGAVVASQYLGRRQKNEASRTAVQLVYTMLIISAAFTVITLVFRKPILSLLFGSIEADVMNAALRYFEITMLALPGIALYGAAAALFRAERNSKISMLASLVINIVNISGNAICIFGLKWGVEGVAVPTLVSRLAAAALLVVLLYKGERKSDETENSSSEKECITIEELFRQKLDVVLIRKILQIGIPNGIENSIFQIGKILVLSLIATFGTSAIAANAVANTLASMEILPPAAINLAMLTVIGQCAGAGDNRQIMYYTKKLMVIAYASMIIWNIPLLLCAGKILDFYNLPQETTTLAWWIVMCHGVLGMIFWPMSFTLPNALRAVNDATFTMIVSMISMWTIRIGMSYVFKETQIFGLIPVMGWTVAYGTLGTWMAMVLDWGLRSACFIIRFAGGKWKGRKLI